ncbi:helix-turn-helix domain-containing protein [Streptomyces olindensis]|uniref:Helix-turn-helix domain-containing protein n=1 Tax=Streptomyces olindensis TaxID=358823 RepID=A0ABV2XN90_9ACTN
MTSVPQPPTGPRPNELGAFVRARRAELTRDAIGLPHSTRPRRVPGLRREEVALLSGISVGYYDRIEQGRARASTPVLARVAETLRLDDEQRAHLFELAGKAGTGSGESAAPRVKPQLRWMLDDLTAAPAVVMGRRTDVLAWNEPAAALFTDFGQLPSKERNFARLVFTDPAMRTLYRDWADIARAVVARLRGEAAHRPDDPRLALLVGELSMRDEDFRRWWADDRVTGKWTGAQHLRHPAVGDLTLRWDALTGSADHDQQLVVWTAEPGTPSHDVLRLLGLWAADDAERLAPDSAR